MKPFRHPKDSLLAANPGALIRQAGKKRKGWKMAAVAKLAPHELDGVKESDIHDQMESEIQDSGLPYISFREDLYYWLKQKAAAREWQAMELLAILKDFPDLAVFDVDPGKPWSRCLLLELKQRKGSGKPGQRRLAEAAGGTIAKGYVAAHEALSKFLHPLTQKETP